MENEDFKLRITHQFSYVGNEFKKSLRELCDEIDRIDTSFPMVIGLISKMPYELAVLVVGNLKYSQDMYRGTLNSIYYDEFNSDIKIRDSNRKSKFQNRLTCQKTMKYEIFAIQRLLTISEIENLIKIFIEENKLSTSVGAIVSDKENIVDLRLKILVKAHKFLSKESNAKINQAILKKMDKFWLDITLRDIIDRKEKGLNR